MPASIAITGSDTLIIQGINITDFATGDVGKITFPNDLIKVIVGKNLNAIFATDYSGQLAEVEVGLLRGSANDRALNALLLVQNLAGARKVLLQGVYIKVIGHGNGRVTNDTYALSFGVFTKIPEAVTNTTGTEEQAITKYHLKFSNAARLVI